jgi:Glyoxalase superfamily protein
MSRDLPARPNLEHLRKQAKDLLPDLQRQSADAKLADAQHAIAREYGFPNWSTLKAHVESLSGPEAVPSNPFVGRWTANLAKSKRHPSNPFQSATLEFAVTGDTVTITNTGVNASGQEERGENTIQADGKVRISDYGYGLTARWRGSNILETVATKDGEVVGRGIYEVSGDGKTLTVSAANASANAGGWQSEMDQVIVLDRE